MSAYRISDGEVTVELQQLLYYGNLLLLDCHVKTSGTKLWIVHGQESTSHVNVLPVWSMAKKHPRNMLITIRSYSLAKMQVLLSNYIIYMHTLLPWPLHRHTKAPVEAVAAQLCQGATALVPATMHIYGVYTCITYHSTLVYMDFLGTHPQACLENAPQCYEIPK